MFLDPEICSYPLFSRAHLGVVTGSSPWFCWSQIIAPCLLGQPQRVILPSSKPHGLLAVAWQPHPVSSRALAAHNYTIPIRLQPHKQPITRACASYTLQAAEGCRGCHFQAQTSNHKVAYILVCIAMKLMGLQRLAQGSGLIQHHINQQL